MIMISGLLHSARDRIIRNKILLKYTKPAIDMYRRGMAVLGPSTTTVTVDNISAEFYTESFEEVRHFWPVLAEKDELSDLLSELKPADTFYDIGAHVGIYTCCTSQTISDGQVVAFEPVQINVERVHQNLQLNNASADIHSVALSDEAKQLELNVDSDSPGTIGHLRKNTAKASSTISTVVGDEYIQENNIPLPNVIKMDVEGAECKVLRGLEGSLDECRVIYSEVSDALQKYGDSQKTLIELLRKNGFEIEYLCENDVTHGDLKATRS